MRLALALVVLLLAPAAAAFAEPQPLGVVEQTLARFDRDTLTPVGPAVELQEPHTSPVMAPGAKRFAIGVSHPGLPDIPVQATGRTMQVTTRRFDGAGTSAAVAGGSLAISGPLGLRVLDLRTWRVRARERRNSEVYLSGRRFIVAGRGRVAARAASGRVLWRTGGNLIGVAAGRVYAQPAVLDAATGRQVGTHPQAFSWLKLI